MVVDLTERMYGVVAIKPDQPRDLNGPTGRSAPAVRPELPEIAEQRTATAPATNLGRRLTLVKALD